MKTFKYIAAGLLVSGIFAANSFASITVHNKLKDEVIIRTDGLMQADKDAERADMILYIKPEQKATFELWKNPHNQKYNIFEDKLNTYVDWPSAPWKIVFLDGTISKSSSDKMNGNNLINDKNYEITRDSEGYVLKEIGISKTSKQSADHGTQDRTEAIVEMAKELKFDAKSMEQLRNIIAKAGPNRGLIDQIEVIFSTLYRKDLPAAPAPSVLDDKDKEILMHALYQAKNDVRLVERMQVILYFARLLNLKGEALKSLVNIMDGASHPLLEQLEVIVSTLARKDIMPEAPAFPVLDDKDKEVLMHALYQAKNDIKLVERIQTVLYFARLLHLKDQELKDVLGLISKAQDVKSLDDTLKKLEDESKK